jgi:phosphopantothenoylcysteine decarboxylase / phosphopantothenate---cysteine ligase
MNKNNLSVFDRKKIVLGVTGSIAAYKAAGLCSKLVKLGAEVYPVLTPNALNFINPLTFSSLSGRKTICEQFKNEDKIYHVSLSHSADLIVIAPATANTISKLANGICDNFLTTAAVSAYCPVCVAPAMNQVMYLNGAVSENIARLKESGQYFFVEPDHGMLACGETGIGRLAEEDSIITEMSFLLNFKNDFKGKKILITAGGTKEFIDSVRYISNLSSGKMGYSLAREAYLRGAESVVLVSASKNMGAPFGVDLKIVENTSMMLEEINRFADQSDIIIMTAAVSDIVPEQKYAYKLKKNDDIISKLKFKENINILSQIARKKRKGQFLVGFSAESGENIENAKNKIADRNIDMIILNDISRKDIGFESEYNEVTVINKDMSEIKLEKNKKILIAREIFNILREKI